MECNIDISLIKQQLNHIEDVIKRENTIKSENKCIEKRTIIVPCNFFSMNEIKITEKIKKIPYNEIYYDKLIDYDLIKIGQLHEKVLENIESIESPNNQKYLLFEYNANTNTIENINNFLFKFNTPREIIFNSIETYSYLLESLIKLNKENVCYFDLCCENIRIKENGHPLLTNFKNSLIINKLAEESYILKIIKNVQEFTYKPLEIHLLFYLMENDEKLLTVSFAQEISENFVKNLGVLSLFSQSFIDLFKKSCIDFLKTYIGLSKDEIIDDILNYHNTWDNYSLSILYLHIFGNICRVFSLKGSFISKFIICLTKNISPEPLKRETLENTQEKYNRLFDEYPDWSFIKNIPLDRMDKLYDFLSK